MDQLEELFKQMQELAGVGLDMLQGAKGAAEGKGGPGGSGGPDGGGPPPEGGAPRGPGGPDGGGPPRGPGGPDGGGDGQPKKDGPKPPPFGR